MPKAVTPATLFGSVGLSDVAGVHGFVTPATDMRFAWQQAEGPDASPFGELAKVPSDSEHFCRELLHLSLSGILIAVPRLQHPWN